MSIVHIFMTHIRSNRLVVVQAISHTDVSFVVNTQLIGMFRKTEALNRCGQTLLPGIHHICFFQDTDS